MSFSSQIIVHNVSTRRAKSIVLKSKYSEQLSKDEALDLALEAAELHIKFLSLVKSKSEKEEIRRNCDLILNEAERIKAVDIWEPNGDLLVNFKPLQPSISSSASVKKDLDHVIDANATLEGSLDRNSEISTTQAATFQLTQMNVAPANSRKLSPNEEKILLQASKLHESKFPPWKNSPDSEEFEASASQKLFTDEPEIRMSNDQRNILDGWKRPIDALPPPSWSSDASSKVLSVPLLPSMFAENTVDFVQDAATDCSVVASLAAVMARAEKGHTKLLSTIIFPYDEENDCPAISPNGKYVIRLNFNGCARKVAIDDRLPVSRTVRVLHVVDRSNPSLLWPALLEKSYLKVRGGYDFPGSNSGTDLWILSGWIPEQVILQQYSDETNVSRLWYRIFQAFGYGDVIVTLGTGKMTLQAETDSGLAGEHDYAVLDMKENDLRRYLLVKNPWLKGTAWKNPRNYTYAPNTSDDTDPKSAPFLHLSGASGEQIHPAEVDSSRLGPGTFWMEMNDVMQFFESIYLNWNPGLFKLRQDIHFTWDLSSSKDSRSPPGSFVQNPQHVVTSEKGGAMWLVLSKHFKDKTPSTQSQSDGGYISLYAFSGNHRMNLSKGATKQGFYVDSPQAMLQLELPPRSSYTIVVSEEELPISLHTFTLTAFSNSQFTLDTAISRYTAQKKIHSSWTQNTAGGNSNVATYSNNPQFSLVLPSRSTISLVLETLIPDVSIHVKLLHGYGHRVFSITAKDIVVDSGNYRRGCAQAHVEDLDAGTYTIICSTFEAGQQGDFTLLVESMTQHNVTPIPKEGAGRLRTSFADASFSARSRNLAAPLAPLRLARVNFTAKYRSPSGGTPLWNVDAVPPHRGSLAVHSPTRLTVELGRGPDRRILISSSGGAFSDSTGGMRTDDLDLSPDMNRKNDLWLVLERLGGFEGMGRLEERVAVDMWTDVDNAIDAGVWREWER